MQLLRRLYPALASNSNRNRTRCIQSFHNNRTKDRKPGRTFLLKVHGVGDHCTRRSRLRRILRAQSVEEVDQRISTKTEGRCIGTLIMDYHKYISIKKNMTFILRHLIRFSTNYNLSNVTTKIYEKF